MSQRNAEQLPEAGREQSVLLSRVNHRTGVYAPMVCTHWALTRRLCKTGGELVVVEKVIPPHRQTPNYYAFLNNCEKLIFIFYRGLL